VRRYLIFLLSVMAVLVSGCSSLGSGRDVNGQVPLDKAVTEVAENQLLDVWIELFDPGELPDDEDEAMGL